MDWQARYEEGNTPWDKGYVTPVLDALIRQKPSLFPEGRRVFVPGCGIGYDAERLAEAGCDVVGMDIAKHAVEQARVHVPEGVQLEFEHGDIFELEATRRFQMVWEHTCLCALEPEMRSDYVEAMWRVLGENGCLLGVFFTNPDVAPGEGPPYGASRDVLRDLFSTHFVLEWEWEPTVAYSEREGREHVMLFRRLTDCSEVACGG